MKVRDYLDPDFEHLFRMIAPRDIWGPEGPPDLKPHLPEIMKRLKPLLDAPVTDMDSITKAIERLHAAMKVEMQTLAKRLG